MGYDILDNKRDLHLLSNAEPNSEFDKEGAMDDVALLADCTSSRCVDKDKYNIDVLELYQDDSVVSISKLDAEAIAKHFGII